MPSRKTNPDGAARPAVDLQAFAEVNRRSVHAMTEMNRRMFRAMLDVQSEILDFTQRRLTEDVAAARMLAGCKEPETAVKIVQGFQARAMEDFAKEAGELMRIGASVAMSPAADTSAESDSPSPKE